MKEGGFRLPTTSQRKVFHTIVIVAELGCKAKEGGIKLVSANVEDEVLLPEH